MALTQFGWWLEKVMRDRGIVSQRELARRLSVSHPTVWRWMNKGTIPKPEEVAALSRLLRVSRYEIYVELGLLEPKQEDRYLKVLGLLEQASPEDLEKIGEFARFVIGQ